MKRNYKSGADKKKDKKLRSETASTCSKLMTAWLNKPPALPTSISSSVKPEHDADDHVVSPNPSDDVIIHQTNKSDTEAAINSITKPEKSLCQQSMNTGLKESDCGVSRDIATYVNYSEKLSFGQRSTALTEVWTPDLSFEFPGSGKRNLRFQIKWLNRWKWLTYSKQEDGAYCKFCVLFSSDKAGMGSQPLGKLVKTKYSRWKNAIEDFCNHEKNDYHKKCLQQATNHQMVANQKQDAVNLQIDAGLKKQIEENRAKIKPIIETIILCGRQNISLRGHRDYGPIDLDKEPLENEGNFRSLLRFRVNGGDEVLKSHLKSTSNNAMYISPHTQNELISCCNDFIVNKIVRKINSAQCFTILADETTDIAGVQQMSLGVRYFDEEAEKLREDFLQFVPVKDATGRGLAAAILNTLSTLGIDMTYMRGQGYDGASAMSGDFNGVQAVVKETYPLALYMHCSSHVLNLAISDACNIQCIRNCLSTINSVYTFHVSPKRLIALQKSIETEVPESKRTRLKAVCPTRWVERHDCISVFMELFDAVIQSLSTISQWSDREAASSANQLLCALQSSEFIVSVNVVKHIFSITAPLSRFLQSEELDLVKAMGYASATEERLVALRNNAEEEFKTIYDDALLKADLLDIKVSIPRRAGRQTQRCNIETDEPEVYFRVSVFIPFLDSFIQQLKTRYTKHKEILQSFQCLLPSNNKEMLNKEDEENIKMLGKKYITDVGCSEHTVLGEVLVWHSYVAQQKKYPKSAVEALCMCDKSTLPAVHALLKVFVTLPVTTASSERSFSTLRRLKTYLRNTTNETRLNGLALLHIHRDINITPEDVLREFSSKPRRLEFVL